MTDRHQAAFDAVSAAVAGAGDAQQAAERAVQLLSRHLPD
jgi:hypothetical protein